MRTLAAEIRILLIDDHSLFRESLSRLLEAEPGFQVAGSCASLEEGLYAIASVPVDIVLLDYDLGEEHGLTFQERAKKLGFQGKFLMVTAGMSDAGTLEALRNGAAGIFLKHSPPVQLIEAILSVLQGDTWLDPKAVNSLVAGANTQSAEERRVQPLTARERMVLNGVFEGLTNKEIGGKLGISESSVKAGLQQLFAKTGVRTRSQLVRIALEKYARNGD